MKIGVAREVEPGEKRVAAIPETVAAYVEEGFEVVVEAGAGEAAGFSDDAYEEAGGVVVDEPKAVWEQADILLKVLPPAERPEGDEHEADWAQEGQILICLYWPAQNQDLTDRLGDRGTTVLALDCIPRISRAQAMDVLSSQAGISGYRAVVEAIHNYGRYPGVQYTAAGRTEPARVLVIGAGVAGLAAIAAARELGAEVYAFDTRLAVKEEVQSLGATFLELEFNEEGEGAGGYAKVMSQAFIDAEMALFQEQAPLTDIVVTTAAIPGRKAPLLVKEEMVKAMKPGSVVVDLAAATGGNCELTEAGEKVEYHGVTILGYTDLASRMANHASEFFSQNVAHLLELMGGPDEFAIDLNEKILRDMIVLKEGELMWPPPKLPPQDKDGEEVAQEEDEETPVVVATDEKPAEKAPSRAWLYVALASGVAFLLLIGTYAPPDFIHQFTIFVLACFVGWKVIWNVKPSLHTPLLSVTNAISGIIILGGILQVTTDAATAALLLGVAATFVASINVFGGFLVTQRMLRMFRSEDEAAEVHRAS